MPNVPGPHTSCVISLSTFTQMLSPGLIEELFDFLARIFSVAVIARCMWVTMKYVLTTQTRGEKSVENSAPSTFLQPTLTEPVLDGVLDEDGACTA